jgi:GT2 family glycosyltransferase
MAPDLTIAIIADNARLVIPCLQSVFDYTQRINLEVFLVDNASADKTGAIVKAAFPQVEVIHNETRLGFSTNNNLALQRGTGRYLMLLNDDTIVKDEALDRVVEFLDAHSQAGSAGCYLLNPDGTFQAAFARFPNPIIEGLWPATLWSKEAPLDSAPYEVDSVCGAAMIVRRATADQVGLLDTHFDPIYSEEVDWCYRIKRAGWKIYTLPQAQVVHYGSVTMNRVVPRRYELLLSHKVLYFRKNVGNIAAATYRIMLMGSTLVKVVMWSVKSWLRPNEQAREKRDLHRYILTRIFSW